MSVARISKVHPQDSYVAPAMLVIAEEDYPMQIARFSSLVLAAVTLVALTLPPLSDA